MRKRYEKPEIELIDFRLENSIMTEEGDLGFGDLSGTVGNEDDW